MIKNETNSVLLRTPRPRTMALAMVDSSKESSVIFQVVVEKVYNGGYDPLQLVNGEEC